MSKKLSFLSFLSSEARGGIQGMALHGCPQEDTSPAFCIQHPKNRPHVFMEFDP
jgi:hypothetical protein